MRRSISRLPLTLVVLCAFVGGTLLLAALLDRLPLPARAQERRPGTSHVKLPLDAWNRILDELKKSQRATEAEKPRVGWCVLGRELDGEFRKGLLAASLVTRFEVLDRQGWIQVPIIDAGAALQEVTLNDRPASLRRDGEMYVIGVSEPGQYTLKVWLLFGEERDRFARRLRFRLPPAGPTRVTLTVPERDIEPHLSHGALAKQTSKGQTTTLEGQLDATGVFDLSWKRRQHKKRERCRLEARQHTLFTVHEALVTGVAVFDFTVLEGETDRIELHLPRDVEVIRVKGDAVLQWTTDEQQGGRLSLLLKYLVHSTTRAVVHFQLPADIARPVALRMPAPKDARLTKGFAGVQAASGLRVRIASRQGGQPLAPRDLPPTLTSLSPSPLLFGFRFARPPTINLAVARHRQVALTGTVVDEIEASTVLLETGAVITKLKLHIRNNTRQYLGLRLPPGATLIQSLMDGHPNRPAVTREGKNETLLFPLRQSERLKDRDTVHRVRPNETLGDIALHYYSNPSRWPEILQANRKVLRSASGLRPGQRLKIPHTRGLRVRESLFVIELAYKEQREALGAWGSQQLRLPRLDVDAIKATWHVYVPSALEPLAFSGNLEQVSYIRSDVFSRIRRFLKRALKSGEANAAGGRYRSILDRRKDIFKKEARRRSRESAVLGNFPLTGTRYRFRRILMGREVASLQMVYVSRSTGRVARHAAWILAFGLTLLLLGRRRRWWMYLITGAGLGLLMLQAHYVLGVHRRILWGVDLALAVALARLHGPRLIQGLRERVRAPWRLGELASVRNVILALVFFVAIYWLKGYPGLFYLGLAVVLGAAFYLSIRPRPAKQEVDDA